MGPNVREFDEPMLWSTMRRLGVNVGKEAMKEIMTYYDIRLETTRDMRRVSL